jgi:two-component SAPR family response regulator
LLGQVLVRGNLLLADVVDEGLSLVHIYHHGLLASWERCWVSGHRCRLRDGWRVKLVDEDTRWYLSASRTKLRQDVHCNVVVADDVMELETVELVLELADF